MDLLNFFVIFISLISFTHGYELINIFYHDNKDDWIINMVRLKENFIASRAYNGEIKIWNALNGITSYTINRDNSKYKLETGKGMVYFEEMNLLAIEYYEYNLVFDTDELYEVDENISIKIYDLEKGDFRYDLVGHQYRIEKMTRLDNGYLASADNKGFIKIWDMKSGLLKYTFPGSFTTSSLIELDNHFIAAGEQQGNVRIFDTNTGRIRYLLNGTIEYQGGYLTSSVQTMKLMNDGYLVVLHGRYIKIWDIVNGKLKAFFNSGMSFFDNKLETFSNGYIAVGDSTGNIRIYDAFSQELINIFDTSNNGHTEKITELIAMKNGNLLSTSQDGLVKIWDLNNGKLKEKIQTRNPINGALLLNDSIMSLIQASTIDFITVWDLDK